MKSQNQATKEIVFFFNFRLDNLLKVFKSSQMYIYLHLSGVICKKTALFLWFPLWEVFLEILRAKKLDGQLN